MTSPRARPEPDGPDGALTHDQWGALVREWNALLPDERRLEELRCRRRGGHDFLPLPAPHPGGLLCWRCFRRAEGPRP